MIELGENELAAAAIQAELGDENLKVIVDDDRVTFSVIDPGVPVDGDLASRISGGYEDDSQDVLGGLIGGRQVVVNIGSVEGPLRL